MIKRNAHKLLSIVLNKTLGNLIIRKRLKGFDKVLSYEISQHMTFLFKKEISYEVNVWNNIKDYLSEEDLIFDIGGNIGQYALRFSEKVGDRGLIISIEPDSKNYSFLNFNTYANKCYNIKPLNIGLGDKSESVTFYRDTQTGGRLSSFSLDALPEGQRNISELRQVDTFDNLVNLYGQPNFVKIDVEGFEVNVINGIKTFSDKTKFLIEVRENTKRKVFEMMSANHYNCYLVDHSAPILILNADEIPSFADLFFLKD